MLHNSVTTKLSFSSSTWQNTQQSLEWNFEPNQDKLIYFNVYMYDTQYYLKFK